MLNITRGFVEKLDIVEFDKFAQIKQVYDKKRATD
jgi:hypothetical protein